MHSSDQDLGPAQNNSDGNDVRFPKNPRQQRTRQKWSKGRQNSNFTGKTREMNGQVFQLQLEQKKKANFKKHWINYKYTHPQITKKTSNT